MTSKGSILLKSRYHCVSQSVSQSVTDQVLTLFLILFTLAYHVIVSDSLLSKKELVHKLQLLYQVVRKLPYMLALQASAATEQEIKKLPDWA